MNPPRKDVWKHQGLEGETADLSEDSDQLVWCPNVGEWMSRRDHYRRFVKQWSGDFPPQ